MSKPHQVIETAYGLLDLTAFEQARESYDTSVLLRTVDELDQMQTDARGDDGLRNILLRLHGMAHTVINGAGMSVPTGEDSLPELASDVISDIRQTIELLQAWIKRIEPLEELAPRS